MNIETYRNYCLSLPGATENFPFDDQILAYKVGGKIFTLTNVDDFASINVKCNPEWAVELREQYHEIIPGYHMNKKHWNTVSTIGSLTDRFIKELVDHSYELVYHSLPRKTRESI